MYRLQINIQCGPATSPRDDVALHLSIRPNERVVVRNHWQNRQWGPEERYGAPQIHFGQPFDLLVLAEHSQYKIAINGLHFCTFTHRIPLQRIQFVDVSGQGSIQFIGLEGDATSMPVIPPQGHIPPFVNPQPIGPPHGGIRVLPANSPYDPPPYQGPGLYTMPGTGSESFIESEIVIHPSGRQEIISKKVTTVKGKPRK